jgi:hypothetical protein
LGFFPFFFSEQIEPSLKSGKVLRAHQFGSSQTFERHIYIYIYVRAELWKQLKEGNTGEGDELGSLSLSLGRD